MVTLAERAVVAGRRRCEQISQEWLGDKELPEMGFTLGGVDEALDPRGAGRPRRWTPTGQVHGVTSWMPVYGGEARSSAGRWT